MNSQPSTTALLAMGPDHVRAAARQLFDRHAACRSSRTSADGSIFRRWHLDIRRLGFPFLWQPFLGSVATLACDSRLVHRCCGDIISSVVRPMPPNEKRIALTGVSPTGARRGYSPSAAPAFAEAWLAARE